ncbi:MAG: TIGR04211 family SH3 domain-containing protein [Nevskiales bacterium]
MIKTWKFLAQSTCAFAVLLQAPFAWAQSAGRQEYISDEISVTIRQKPTNDSESLGVIKSGARVSVLETLGPDSFAHIRTSDGRDGWITSRFLSEQPAAKDQLTQLKQQLDQAHTQAQSLQRDLDTAQQQLAKAKPALEMAGENDKLRATIVQREEQVGALERQFDAEKARRETLVTGGILVGGGIFVGLILPWLGGRKKRRSDF